MAISVHLLQVFGKYLHFPNGVSRTLHKQSQTGYRSPFPVFMLSRDAYSDHFKDSGLSGSLSQVCTSHSRHESFETELPNQNGPESENWLMFPPY